MGEQKSVRSKSELKEIRDKAICSFRKSGGKIEALAYMFNLSEASIKQITQGVEVFREKDISIESLDATVQRLKKDYLSDDYTEQEIEYIFNRKATMTTAPVSSNIAKVNSLPVSTRATKVNTAPVSTNTTKVTTAPASTTANTVTTAPVSTTTNASLEKRLEDAKRNNDVLKSKLESLEKEFKKLTEEKEKVDKEYNEYIIANAQAELKRKKLEEQLNAEQEKTKGLSETIESLNNQYTQEQEKSANLQEQLNGSRADIENLKIKLDTERKTSTSLGNSVRKLNKELSEQSDLYQKEKSRSDSLVQKLSRLQSTNAGLGQQLNTEKSKLGSLRADLENKDSRIADLESQIESLESQLEIEDKRTNDMLDDVINSYQEKIQELQDKIDVLTVQQVTAPVSNVQQTTAKGSTKFQKVYTDAQRQQMVDYYVSQGCVLTEEGLKAFISSTGIQISDSGFRKVCKEMQTYKNRKKKRGRPKKKK